MCERVCQCDETIQFVLVIGQPFTLTKFYERVQCARISEHRNVNTYKS